MNDFSEVVMPHSFTYVCWLASGKGRYCFLKTNINHNALSHVRHNKQSNINCFFCESVNKIICKHKIINKGLNNNC